MPRAMLFLASAAALLAWACERPDPVRPEEVCELAGPYCGSPGPAPDTAIVLFALRPASRR